MEVSEVFSYNNVITLIESRSFVYRTFNFEMYSLVFNTAVLVNKAVLLGIIILATGLIKPTVKLLIVKAGPIKISLIINNAFFLFKNELFFYNMHFQFYESLKHSQNRVFQFYI